MPIKKKICKIGMGYAIFLPKSWITLLEEKYGSIKFVAVEVNEVLKISPIPEKNTVQKETSSQ